MTCVNVPWDQLSSVQQRHERKPKLQLAKWQILISKLNNSMIKKDRSQLHTSIKVKKQTYAWEISAKSKWLRICHHAFFFLENENAFSQIKNNCRHSKIFFVYDISVQTDLSNYQRSTLQNETFVSKEQHGCVSFVTFSSMQHNTHLTWGPFFLFCTASSKSPTFNIRGEHSTTWFPIYITYINQTNVFDL